MLQLKTKLPQYFFKRKGMRNLIVLVVVSIILSGCKKAASEGIYEKGRIEYKIQYIENNHNHISSTLLPKKMKLEFNQEYSTNVIEGFMGVFRLNSVINFKHKRCSTLLEILNKNYLFKGKRGDEMCCFEPMNKMEIAYTEETKQIAGLNCKKAIIKLPEKNEKFEVYYTNDIRLSNANISNPYSDIDGVMMDFQLNLTGLKMKFTAEKFEKDNNIKPHKLKVPDNCTIVTRQQMVQIINKLME